MQKKYIAPEMEIIEFESEDIITTSKTNSETIDFPITTIP